MADAPGGAYGEKRREKKLIKTVNGAGRQWELCTGHGQGLRSI